MINIRRNVFETNSSSMHSLVVVKNPKPYDSRELHLNCYNPEHSYELFGWGEDDANFGRHPYKVLRDPQDKLRYYVAHELGNCEKYEKIDEIKEFISKHTSVPVSKISITVRNRDEGKRDYYGYIEHNDTGESPFEYLNRKHISMEEFIMNPKYVVIVDGDEYGEFKKLFESNILDANNLEDISSGADFWNDAEAYICLSWLTPNKWGNEYTDEDCVDEVSSFKKRFAVYIAQDDIKAYDPV